MCQEAVGQRPVTTRALSGLLILYCFAGTAQAQSVPIACVASDRATQWPTSTGSASGPESVPALDILTALLVGRYTIDLVTTEGVDTPAVSRWHILIRTADSTVSRGQVFAPRARYVFVGTRTDVPHPTPVDSLRRGRFPGRLADLEMLVDSASGRLWWHTDPRALDSGLIFDVAEVNATGFWGRWVGGGYAMAILKRGGLTVGETARGYYCAHKEQ